ncbi:MAG: hypothetical protein LBD99_06945 [Candidatus Margulisbacteria bacterium]|jgi:hypothetical protein|nr:hypothetical protein [Candidatus Margulisiibacteriota bacterium]
MFKRSLLVATIILFSYGFCGDGPPPGEGSISTPEPVSTTMVGAALASLFIKKFRERD